VQLCPFRSELSLFRVRLLRRPVVNTHDIVVSAIGSLKELIKFRMNGLRVPMFGSLYNQCHSPSGERGE
jgi:hypothetical protein